MHFSYSFYTFPFHTLQTSAFLLPVPLLHLPFSLLLCHFSVIYTRIYFLFPCISIFISTFLTQAHHTKIPLWQKTEFSTSVCLKAISMNILNHALMGARTGSYSCRKFLSSCKDLWFCCCSLQETEDFFLKVKQPTIWCRNIWIVRRNLMSPGLVWFPSTRG